MILDHHESTIHDLSGIDGCFFDKTKSGVGMVHAYFGRNEFDLDMFMQYIQDRDLWTFKLYNTKAFTAFFYKSINFNFYAYDMFTENKFVTRAIELGEKMLKEDDKKLQAYCNQSQLVKIPSKLESPTYYTVRICECEEFDLVSDLGHRMALMKDNDFAIVWRRDRVQVIKCSVRSLDDMDVSEFAKRYNGGGHKNASAFMWEGPIEKLFV
jgi:nanoRNase/pAp phosphatase (c-di-AMP/oligoRNAs hydrolase)